MKGMGLFNLFCFFDVYRIAVMLQQMDWKQELMPNVSIALRYVI